MRRPTKPHSRTLWQYWMILVVLIAVVIPGRTYLDGAALAANTSGDGEATDANSSSDQQERLDDVGPAAREQQSAVLDDIERSIRQYFESMSKRDVEGVRAVLDTRFVAIEAGEGIEAGRLNAVVHLVDTANSKEVLPPKENDDWEKLKISDVKAEISKTHRSVATATFTITFPLDAETFAAYQEALKYDANELSDSQKKKIAKRIGDGAINTSMFAMLARQDGKWKIVCMSFPDRVGI